MHIEFYLHIHQDGYAMQINWFWGPPVAPIPWGTGGHVPPLLQMAGY